MKTEQQIRKKYEEMLEHTKYLMDKVRNPLYTRFILINIMK